MSHLEQGINVVVHATISYINKPDVSYNQEWALYLNFRIDTEHFLDFWVENEVEEEWGIVLEMDEYESLEYMVMELSLREFFNSHHLMKYIESKVNREKGTLIPKSLTAFSWKLLSS